MFYLDIQQGNESNTGGGFQVFSKHGLTVRYRQNQLYAFLYEIDDLLIVGESLANISLDRCKQLSQQIAQQNQFGGIPDDAVQFLALVDFQRGTCRIATSISNGRSYFFVQDASRLTITTSTAELAKEGVKLTISQLSRPEYLTYRSVAPMRTHFDNVERFIAGQRLTFAIGTGTRSEESLWPLREGTTDPRGVGEGIDKVGAILQKQISNLLPQYSKPGSLLSGGNDSSLLTVMGTKTHPKLPVYTTGFSKIDPNDNEGGYAKGVADHLGLPSTFSPPSAEEYLRGLVEAIAGAGEPLDHLQTVLLHLLYKRIAADGCDILICGQMADALFGDSLLMTLHKYQTAVNMLDATKLHAPLRWLYRASKMQHGRIDFLSHDFGSNIETSEHILWTLYRYCDHTVVEKYFTPDATAYYAGRAELIRKFPVLSIYDRISIINYLGQAGSPLGQWGRLAENQGIRFFYPFLAPELVNYLFSLPWEYKMSWNETEPKHALRSLLRKYDISENLISRPKQSFGFSFTYWAFPDTLFQPIVDMASGTFDRALLRSLQTGVPSQGMLLWTLLNTFIWEQLFVAKRTIDDVSGEILDRRAKQVKPH